MTQQSNLGSNAHGIHPHLPFSIQAQTANIKSNYDYIILGAGSAGCIVAARLASAFPNLSILMVEADASGGRDALNPIDFFSLRNKDRFALALMLRPEGNKRRGIEPGDPIIEPRIRPLCPFNQPIHRALPESLCTQ